MKTTPGAQAQGSSSRGQGQDRTVDLPLFRRTLIPTELPDLTGTLGYLTDSQAAGPGQAYHVPAVLTGFEPATSTLTGWRALLAALQDHLLVTEPYGNRAPNGIRTRAAALKGRCPGPLDDGGPGDVPPAPLAPAVGNRLSIGEEPLDSKTNQLTPRSNR